MKKRRLLLTLLALLLVTGIPMGFLIREYRQERLNQDLIAAIKVEDTDKVLAALKSGANPNARDYSQKKQPSVFEQIREMFRPSDVSPTALMLLCNLKKTEQPTLFRILLNAGANPNLTGLKHHCSPLMLASYEKPQAFQLLLTYGANVHLTDDVGGTPLHYAAYFGTNETINSLLKAGSETEAKSKDGLTPLFCACFSQNMPAMKALLDHHVHMNIEDKRGFTPLDYGYMSRNSDLVKLLKQAGAKTGKELSSQPATPPKH